MSPGRERAPLALGSLAGTLLAAAALALASPTINEDGVQYLDLADAWRSGDWPTALNTYWSPFYSWALAAVLAMARPEPAGELGVARAFNLATLAALLVAWLSLTLRLSPRAATTPAHRWTWPVMAGLAGAWVMLQTMGVESLTPDLLASVLIVATALAAVRAVDRRAGPRDGLVLGLLIGSAALARSVLVALAPAGVYLLRRAGARTIGATTALALGVLSTFGAFVLALSIDEGRITAGDTGALNYAWFVNRVTRYVHWQGDEPGSGVAAHPTRVDRAPDVFVFDRPWPCTFPPACDPGYWHEGLRLHFDWREQWTASLWVLDQWRWVIVPRLAALPLVLLALALLADRPALADPRARACWWLAAAAVAGYVGVYSEARHVGGALLLAMAPCLAALRRPTRLARAATVLLLAAAILVAGRSLAAARLRVAPGAHPHPQWAIAQRVTALGVRPGDRVARIGEAPGTYWARLARVRIVGEIPAAAEFWQSPPEVQAARLRRLEAAGARAIVADGRGVAAPDGWTRVEGAPWAIVRRAGP
jgi:hypothetical protein